MCGFHPGSRTFKRRPILAGAALFLVLSGLSIVAVGLGDAVVPILIAGVLGGFVAGWLSLDPNTEVYERRSGGLHGLNASGLGGLILVVILLILDLPARVEGHELLLFLVASPMALIVFILEGLVGGYAGIMLRVATHDSASSD